MPVRRKLLAGSMAYLAGVYAAQAVCLPLTIAYAVCALLLCVGIYRLRHRRSALLFVIAVLFLLGNSRAGRELLLRDEATAPGVRIEGTVSKIESNTRVYLRDAVIDGTRILNRPAAVTLMQETDEGGNPVGILPSVSVGQKISGTGRLFEQDGKRNPGGVDWRIHSLCKGYDLSGYILPGWQVSGESHLSILELFRQARQAFSERLDILFGEHAPLFRAVVVGDKSDMDDELVQAMRLTGIVHILTISGMHMSLVALVLHALLIKLHIRRRLRFCLQALLLGSFACLTGLAMGTIRAYIMALIRECAPIHGRRYEPLTALGAAALIMALVNPLWALSASFQFSFFVVLGIQLLSRQLSVLVGDQRRRPVLVRRILQTAALTFSAQLTAIPMQLMYYGYIPVLAMPMNLVSGFFMPVIMLGGWTVLGVSLVCSQAAQAAANVLGVFTSKLEALSLSASAHPWGIVRLPAPCTLTFILVLIFLFMVSKQVYITRRRGAVCILLIAAIGALYLPRFDPAFRYVQLDVGQGDGAVLRKGREAVLIDVGPEDEYAALRYLRHEGLFVDLVILSHADADHAGALGSLLDSEVRVSRIAMPIGALDDANSQAVLDAIRKAQEMGIGIELYEKGNVITSGAFSFSVLSPDASLEGSNERSLVLYTEMDGMRILTLGDLPEKCEMESVPECDVLKVAHHGSRYATSRELIEQARPEVAIISVGRNSYGHPTDRVLEDLAAAGAKTFRTDQSGCVTVEADESGCMVTLYMDSEEKHEGME